MTHAGKRKIRLLLVDDHEIVRAGLRAILRSYDHLEIIAEANSVDEAVKEAVRLQPDVILMDVRLGDGTGFEASRQIHQQNVPARVLFLTSFSDDEIISQLLASPVDGFLLKDASGAQMAAAIEQVHAGQTVLDSTIARRVLEKARAAASSPAADPTDKLSAQEKRVLALVAEGKTNKEIGVALGLSDKTVKNYLANAMEKLQLNRRSQAAAYFTRQQLKEKS